MSLGSQQVSANINSFNTLNTCNSFNACNVSSGGIVNFNTETDAEGRQILQWLSPLGPQQRHQDVRIDRLDGVGNWVLETIEFREWSNKEDGSVEPVLFCSGDPGVGKTYLR